MGLPIGLGLAWLAFDAIFKEGELVDDYYGIVVEGEKSFQKKILPLFGKYEMGKLF